MDEEHRGKLSDIANQTLKEDSIAEKAEDEKREDLQEIKDKRKLDQEESKKIGIEVKKKIIEAE